MTNSLPWEISIFKNGRPRFLPSISMGPCFSWLRRGAIDLWDSPPGIMPKRRPVKSDDQILREQLRQLEADEVKSAATCLGKTWGKPMGRLCFKQKKAWDFHMDFGSLFNSYCIKMRTNSLDLRNSQYIIYINILFSCSVRIWVKSLGYRGFHHIFKTHDVLLKWKAHTPNVFLMIFVFLSFAIPSVLRKNRLSVA